MNDMQDITVDDFKLFYATYNGIFSYTMASRWAYKIATSDEVVIQSHLHHPLAKPEEMMFMMISDTSGIPSFLTACKTIRCCDIIATQLIDDNPVESNFKLIFISSAEYNTLLNEWKTTYGDNFESYDMMIRQLVFEMKYPTCVQTMQ